MTNDSPDTGLIKSETGAQRLVGYVLDVSQEDGRARCYLRLSEVHLNRHDVMHGGIASTLLDNAMGATASLSVDSSGRTPFMTVSLNTHFLAPAFPGTELVATGKIVRAGKSLQFIDGELTDTTGALIATASGVFKRVPLDRLATR